MIPLVDLRAQHRDLADELTSAIRSVIESAQFVLGPEVAAFEREFAAFCGAAHAVAVNSGTSALHLALLAAGIGPGDEVITVPHTFVATVAAICYAGATPVFVDIHPQTFTMDPARLEAAVTGRTKAVIPVHLYGHPADMEPILAISRRHSLTVIEDAAQAHGAEYNGVRTGCLGDFGCFSFYPSKNLGACGEGGIITTKSAEAARRLRMMRDWGQDVKNHHLLRGYNYRMEAIQAAVLRVKLRHLEAWNERRRRIAAEYRAGLAESGLSLPVELPGNRHVYHLFVVRTKSRGRLRESLQAAGIETGIHYPTPVHLQPAHSDLGYGRGSFPVAEDAAGSVLSVPMFPELTDEQLEIVVKSVLACLRSERI
jgi:dTDP-4-amino-4,6-dideoxygalactose transaminase